MQINNKACYSPEHLQKPQGLSSAPCASGWPALWPNFQPWCLWGAQGSLGVTQAHGVFRLLLRTLRFHAGVGFQPVPEVQLKPRVTTLACSQFWNLGAGWDKAWILVREGLGF